MESGDQLLPGYSRMHCAFVDTPVQHHHSFDALLKAPRIVADGLPFYSFYRLSGQSVAFRILQLSSIPTCFPNQILKQPQKGTAYAGGGQR